MAGAISSGSVVVKWSQKLEDIEVENRKQREKEHAQHQEHMRLTSMLDNCLDLSEMDNQFGLSTIEKPRDD